MRRLFFNLLIFILLPAFAQAGPSVSFRVEGKEEVITLALPGLAAAKVFTLPNPDRLVVDVPTLPQGTKVEMPSGYGGKLVKLIRTGQFDQATTRIVFDLSGPVGAQGQVEKNGTLRIRMAPGAARPATVLAPKQEKAKKKEDTRPVIVIDAGHGGQDPGTIGPRGTQEKDVVLDFARNLRGALLAGGRYRVYMTRDDDRFILLRERMAIARRHKADLFISLHADSAPEGAARGMSVYTLSEKASDAEAEALAARENKVDAVYGLDLSDQSKDVADILISLAQRDTNNRSATVAGLMVDVMKLNQMKLLPNPHRFAGFAVLKSPDTPSILVETGFLSNPAEEKLLASKAYREKIVRALVRGIDAFFAARREAALFFNPPAGRKSKEGIG